MAGGQRTVKIRFTGDAKDLDKTANAAVGIMSSFGGKAKAALGGGLSGIGDVISGALKTPVVGAAVTAAGAAAALAFSAAMGAGIVSGVGIAAIAGPLAIGIKAASNDPAVKAAFGNLGKNAQVVFNEFGEAFKGPLVRAATTFDEALKKMRPTFKEISQDTAPIIDRLAPAFSDMALNSLPGVKNLIKEMKPTFDAIAEKAPLLGTAISKFMDNIKEGGPGAEQFLRDIFDFLIWIVPKVGQALAWLSNKYIAWRNSLMAQINAVRHAWGSFYAHYVAITNSIGVAISWLRGAFNGFKDRVLGIWNGIVGGIASAVQRIEGWWYRLKSLASQAINFSVGGSFNIPGFGGGRARGGPVSAGKSYLVGERGPELITMGGNGYVTPNHKLGGGVDVLELTLDLGRGIQEIISVNLREHDRNLKRRVNATGRV